MAIAAAEEAMTAAGLDAQSLSLDERRAFGVVLGSGGAGLAFTEHKIREYYVGES